VEHSDIRREMVCDCALLRDSNFDYLSGHFFRAPCEVQTLALSASFNVVHNYLRGPREENGISMLRDGSLCAVKRAALHAFSFGVGETQPEQDRLSAAQYALWVSLSIARTVPTEKVVGLSDEMYKLTRNDTYRMNVMSHDILTSSWELQLFLQVDTTLIGYGIYLMEVLGSEPLRSFLLYKPPRNPGAQAIALLIAEYEIKCGEAYKESNTMDSLKQFAKAVPELTPVLAALLPPPERVVKDRYCAQPDCDVTGVGLYNNLKKCNRCRAVYYCCKEHQEEHWPEHRLSCVKATPPTGTVQSAAK
jgi:hypothetical protein